MFRLLGYHKACFIFREHFLTLANMPLKGFRELAREADKVHSDAWGFSPALFYHLHYASQRSRHSFSSPWTGCRNVNQAWFGGQARKCARQALSTRQYALGEGALCLLWALMAPAGYCSSWASCPVPWQLWHSGKHSTCVAYGCLDKGLPSSARGCQQQSHTELQ